MIIAENGIERELEPYEVDALNAARKAKVEQELATQYSAQEATYAFIRACINSVEIPANEAVHMVALHPKWAAGTEYAVGFRVRHGNVGGELLYECVQAHTSQEGWEPGEAPSLWAKVLPGQSGAEIGEWEQPGSTNPYAKGDKVTHGGKTWYSDIDGNVWEPGVYGWVEMEG